MATKEMGPSFRHGLLVNFAYKMPCFSNTIVPLLSDMCIMKILSRSFPHYRFLPSNQSRRGFPLLFTLSIFPNMQPFISFLLFTLPLQPSYWIFLRLTFAIEFLPFGFFHAIPYFSLCFHSFLETLLYQILSDLSTLLWISVVPIHVSRRYNTEPSTNSLNIFRFNVLYMNNIGPMLFCRFQKNINYYDQLIIAVHWTF